MATRTARSASRRHQRKASQPSPQAHLAFREALHLTAKRYPTAISTSRLPPPRCASPDPAPPPPAAVAMPPTAASAPMFFVPALPPRRLRPPVPRVPLAARRIPRAVASDPHSNTPNHPAPPVWRRALAIAAVAAHLFRPAPLRALPDLSAPSPASPVATIRTRRPSLATAIAVSPQTPAQPADASAAPPTASPSPAAALLRRVERLRQSLLTRSDHGDDHSHQHAVNDALVLLVSTVLIIPLARRFGISPILGFLAAGVALGPNAFALVNDVRTTKALAELGVVFFLFEMGLELSTSKLNSLRADVFGLGTAQFFVTGAIITAAAIAAGITSQAAIVVGAALALSSSAFVLQLLSERGEVGTRYGRAAFGILLFQDLVVVPVLVLIPLLAASGAASAVWRAIGVASIKAVIALAFIIFMGNNALQPIFRFVARARSPEAFIAVILFTVLGTSSLTQMLGLSDTLGAFLAGVMLAETKFRHQVEADIKPFRGLLLGLFFMTVGFSIDLNLAWANLSKVVSLVSGLLAIKASVIAAAGVAFGLSVGSALRTGLLLSQGGEFAFVIFGLGQKVGVLPPDLSQLLLLVVAISMAVTPLLAAIGRRISTELEKKRGLIGVRMEDADTADARDFVMVAGWGRVGQSVCEMLDAKLVRYMAFDMSPTRVIHARNKGFPVFFGDASRPEVLRAAGVERARAVVVTLDDPEQALRAVQNIRREFEDVKVFCRARDAKHQKLLQASGATAIVPELLEASLQLGGAVLLDYGTPIDEVSSLVEEARAESLAELGLEDSVTATIGSVFKRSDSPPKVEDETDDGESVEEEDESEEEPILVSQDDDVKSEDVPVVGSTGDVTEDIYETADQVVVAAEDGTARGKRTAVVEDLESDSVR